MINFSHIWNSIVVQDNVFNFVIFVALFVWLFQKIHIGSLIASIQQRIVALLDETKKNKEASVLELKKANCAIANISAEMDEIIEEAQKSAKVISLKITDEAKQQVLSIAHNSKKIIEAEEKKLISKLTKNASTASVKVAEKQIEKALIENPALHEKYINESIEELDRLKF
jgi:F0F1-type ATP synthase membrane subunit b/b'